MNSKGISMGSQPRCTKVFSDFDKIFSACKAFNYKHFDKKISLKTFFSIELDSKYF